ncbi:MAG: hypothetical protein LBI57_01250 [Helicobacteraceae bacterium]|nr:hypothetical protein [Helicobacteraceae bacterium]
MDETLLPTLLIAFSVALICAVIVIVWQLGSRFNVDRKSETKRGRDQANAEDEQKPDTSSLRKSGTLVVAGKRFQFNYDAADSADVKRLLDLIKTSLALLKESKYPDIVSSRARECEGLIKKLRGVTSLNSIAIGEISDRFRAYVEDLSASLA